MGALEIALIVFACCFFLYEVISLGIQISKRVKERKEKSNKEEIND
mgnify:CR=1 FL=1